MTEVVDKPVDVSLLFSRAAPPSATDVEEAVLGALMLDASDLPAVSELLSPEDFYRPAHGLIYQSILDLHLAGEAIDLTTVRGLLDTRGQVEKIGGLTALIDISDSVLSPANVVAHAKLVKDKSILRQVLRVGVKIQSAVYGAPGPVPELLSDIDAAFRTIRDRANLTGADDLYVGPSQMKSRFEALQKVQKVGTGIPVLDAMLEEGFSPDTFGVIAGRTSEGKTAFRQNVMVNLLVAGYGVACFATEPTLRTESRRLLSIRTGIAYDVLKDIDEWKTVDTERYSIVSTALSEIDLWHRHHVFARRPSVAEIEEWVKRIKDRGPLHVVFIDRFDFIKDILAVTDSARKSATIKSVAQQLLEIGAREQIHFCGLVQVKRAGEGSARSRIRAYSRPQLDDLAESRALEDTAELVLFVHRPGKYDSKIPDNQMEVGIAKQREGPAGPGCYVTLDWDGPTRRVLNPDSDSADSNV